MTSRKASSGFAARPGDAETWIRRPEQVPQTPRAGAEFTARLTIDITPDMRGRIKVAAFRRGVTVADMLRAMFTREFPESDGEAS